jgi:hypothetical protein
MCTTPGQIQGQTPIRQLQQYKYTGTALEEQPVPTGEYKMLGLFIANVSAVALASRQHALTAASARRHQHSSCSDNIAAIERFVVCAPETCSPAAGQSGRARAVGRRAWGAGIDTGGVGASGCASGLRPSSQARHAAGAVGRRRRRWPRPPRAARVRRADPRPVDRLKFYGLLLLLQTNLVHGL